MTEVESIHGSGTRRMVFYRYRPGVSGSWHPYGPVFATDPNFDAQAFCAVVEIKMAEALARGEFESLVRGE